MFSLLSIDISFFKNIIVCFLRSRIEGVNSLDLINEFSISNATAVVNEPLSSISIYQERNLIEFIVYMVEFYDIFKYQNLGPNGQSITIVSIFVRKVAELLNFTFIFDNIFSWAICFNQEQLGHIQSNFKKYYFLSDLKIESVANSNIMKLNTRIDITSRVYIMKIQKFEELEVYYLSKSFKVMGGSI